MSLTTAQLSALKQRIEEETRRATDTRHALHQLPELAGHETQTHDLIHADLQKAGLTLKPSLLGTDVIAEIETDSPVTVCLRADMDALPIEEKTGVAYASTHRERMHACGHDGHTAILLSTARILQAMHRDLPVSVRFIFQPGEEMEAMGRKLVEAGGCDGCDEAYALHGRPGYPLGTVTCRPGVMMATGGHIQATFRGRGCHGSTPELGRNPIPAAAAFVQALETLRKELQTSEHIVITPCGINAGLSSNVIPDEARVSGTARYLSAAQHAPIRKQIHEAATTAAHHYGVAVEFSYDTRYAFPVVNSCAAFDRVQQAAIRSLGDEQWIETPEPTLDMEDFAFYLRNREGAMFWLGLGEDHAPLHRNDFDFDDCVIPDGILMFCTLILDRDA